MANIIIETGLGDLEELWGLETTLYYPDLYAGATDVVGIYDGQPAIVDFKQSNKPKRREWIQDYFEQLGAYAMAHNQVYGTKIQSGIILMCTKDFLFQKFEVSGRDFVKHQHAFLRKCDQYHENVSKAKDCADTNNDRISIINPGVISCLDNCIPFSVVKTKNFFTFFKSRVQKVQLLEVLYTNS